jgi:hypothetical protein
VEYNVYKIYNDINDKIYIGQTNRSIEDRLRIHKNDARRIDTYFYRAIRKYGEEHFFIELIDTASNQEELDEKEYIWILSYPKDKLYNTKFSKGKCGGDTLTGNMTQEIHEKISLSKLSGNNPRAEMVKAINVKTGETFIFDSMCECARELNFPDHTCVSKRCLNQAKKPYKKTWNFEFYIEQQSVSTIPDECKGVG